MTSRKKDEVTPPFDYEQERARLAESMRSLHISRIIEMPRIELYRDQVLSIVSTELAPLYAPNEKIVTGSMINNYVKQRVIPAPNRKRYTRYHLALLLFVCCLKRALSIAQIVQLLKLCEKSELDVTYAYDKAAATLEEALAHRFEEGSASNEQSAVPHLELLNKYGEPVGGELPVLLGRAIGLVVDKTFIEKVLDLEERHAAAMAHDASAQTAGD